MSSSGRRRTGALGRLARRIGGRPESPGPPPRGEPLGGDAADVARLRSELAAELARLADGRSRAEERPG